MLVFNVPPTAKVIWRWGHGLKSHPTDWRSRESNLRPLVYKASDLSTTPQRLLILILKLSSHWYAKRLRGYWENLKHRTLPKITNLFKLKHMQNEIINKKSIFQRLGINSLHKNQCVSPSVRQICSPNITSGTGHSRET